LVGTIRQRWDRRWRCGGVGCSRTCSHPSFRRPHRRAVRARRAVNLATDQIGSAAHRGWSVSSTSWWPGSRFAIDDSLLGGRSRLHSPITNKQMSGTGWVLGDRPHIAPEYAYDSSSDRPRIRIGMRSTARGHLRHPLAIANGHSVTANSVQGDKRTPFGGPAAWLVRRLGSRARVSGRRGWQVPSCGG